MTVVVMYQSMTFGGFTGSMERSTDTRVALMCASAAHAKRLQTLVRCKRRIGGTHRSRTRSRGDGPDLSGQRRSTSRGPASRDLARFTAVTPCRKQQGRSSHHGLPLAAPGAYLGPLVRIVGVLLPAHPGHLIMQARSANVPTAWRGRVQLRPGGFQTIAS